MILNELKALANDKRLKVIFALANNDFCQLHIIQITGLTQVDASRSLKALVESGLVDSQKNGNRVIFSLSKKMKEEYKTQLEMIKQEYNYLSFDMDMNDLVDDCKNLVE